MPIPPLKINPAHHVRRHESEPQRATYADHKVLQASQTALISTGEDVLKQALSTDQARAQELASARKTIGDMRKKIALLQADNES